MAQETDKYKFGYYEQGDVTDADIERERWLSLDRQILGLFEVLGNGIIDGWDLTTSDDTTYEISISLGSGHVDYVSVESTEATLLELEPDARNYIYAGIDIDSYYSGYVRFISFTEDPDDSTLLYLGYVDANPLTDSVAIADINTDDRQQLGFREAILQLIKDHRHVGGSDDPSKINLETDVQGFLQPGNIGDLDASLILRGVIDKNRLPKIDHIEDLENKGILTHAQLDTFVQLLDNVGSRLMGEVSTTNLLKLILALKHVYPTIDDYLINEVAFIPGISPDSFVDQTNTTAEVDYRTSGEGGTHTITGTPVESTTTFTKTWDENAEFSETDRSGSVVYGDSIMLSVLENKVYVEDFENVSDWTTEVVDVSDVTTSFIEDTVGGKLDVGNEDAETILLLSKTFDQQDWTKYDRLVLSLYTESAEHGDVYIYISDAVAGSQGSHTIVLERNQATIDPETGNVSWREIVIDISQYEKSNINFVGFYLSTSSGWNTDAAFSINVNNMFITSGNLFRDSGTARFTYGGTSPQIFNKLRWDAVLPDNTSIMVRTRVSNDELLLDSASWSSFITVSGDSIVLPSPDTYYKYIQIETLLSSDDTNRYSPQLKVLYLDSIVAADDFSFSFDTEEDWKSGELNNISADRVPGAITINYVGDIDTYIFGTDGGVKQLGSDLSEKLLIEGASLPKSFRQMLAGEAAGFGQLSSVDFSPTGTFIVSDTENDRVLEIDRDGEVKWGLMGPYISEPTNPYDDVSSSAEESVSTETTETTTASETTSNETAEKTMSPVGCYYDVENSRLSLMFDEDLANIYESGNIDTSKMILKAGTRRVYLGSDNATVELFGMDREHASASVSGSEYFSTSNTLLIDVDQADAVTINNAANVDDPVLTISSPYINKLVVATSITISFSVENCEFGVDCGIRLSYGATLVDIYDAPNYEITGMADGTHSISAVLIDMSGNEYANDSASTTSSFLVDTGAHSDPHLEITSPADNQVIVDEDLTISYNIYNLPAGAKARYSIDGASAIDTGSSPFIISGMSSGAKSIQVFLTDASNVPLTGSFVSATFEIVMSNRNAVTFTILVQESAVNNSIGIGNIEKTIPVNVTPVRIANVRAPVDSRAVFSDRSIGDAENFNVVVAKVGTPSYPNFYSSEGDGFLDGHSVVEFNRSGDVVITSNDAIIARNREQALEFLGSVRKGKNDEFLIGDVAGKRAIVSVVDVVNKTSSIVWEFESDRAVSDFSRVPNQTSEIDINEQGLSNDKVYIRRDTPVTWINRTSENIRIMSGSTTAEQFSADPDFNLYGSLFDSGVLEPGGSYTYRPLDYGTIDFFVWPSIETAKMYVTESPVSPNDKFALVENDVASSSYNSRVILIDAWGKIEWSFGESFLRKIKDATPISDTEIVVSV